MVFEGPFDGGERRAGRQDVVHKNADGSLSEGTRTTSRHADGTGQVAPPGAGAETHLVPSATGADEGRYHPGGHPAGTQAARHGAGQDGHGLAAASPAGGSRGGNGHDGDGAGTGERRREARDRPP